MIDLKKYLVSPEKLRRNCDCDDELKFCESSADISPLNGVIGQERAVRAMSFGLAMDAAGYNIFAVGAAGTGKSTYVKAVTMQAAAAKEVPADWCYINNFNDKDNPMAVSLPAGQGRKFQKDISKMISDLRIDIPKAFEGEVFDKQKEKILQSAQQKIDQLFREIEKKSQEAGFSVKPSQSKFVFIPMKEGKQITPEEYEQLSAAERQDFEEKGRKLQKKLEESYSEGQKSEKNALEQIAELEKRLVSSITKKTAGILIKKYKKFNKIVTYIESVCADISENRELFKIQAPQAEPQTAPLQQTEADPFIRYQVNLFVNNEKTSGAPVIVEPNPNYYNLFGKIEYKSQMMYMNTNFTMVKAGALHKANGGYLILQAGDLFTDAFMWSALKKVLKYRQSIVENIGEQYRTVPTETLKPEAIPMDVKVIIIGSPQLYQLISMDDDFSKLFKVKVDFDTEMSRTKENVCQYAAFVSSVCRQTNSLNFSRKALGVVIEYGSRLAGNQNKLSTRFNEVVEIINESIALAAFSKSKLVEPEHVEKAIAERKFRANQVEEKMQEMILQKDILVKTEGKVVGQLNGLSVMTSGGYSFGIPSRITARVFAGRGGIINIERETDMSGSIHSKGVLTLTGYLGGKFAQKKPLGMTAQVTFEQNYGGVEGDSASSTELYAIISSLAEVPLKQSLAVTGSVDQHGEIQPIGGVTEKIEGFFDICKARGLTGEHGVIIPIQNVDDLMLKKEIVDAATANLFSVYAVKNIEEGIEIITGLPAGQEGKNGEYASGSVFDLVDKKLKSYYDKTNETM